ncbi:dienelactone hydrolase family protein [Demequina sp. SYSU T00039]|uniref:Dienelactone hydrolase family protein n=1 Tax=Demequina lignilytica TaxID=3051663 RepID=A0AAW7M7K9_9MICO|nr:dienelactone hydrolase family protein [Demequina sp. SYSU T00039]MDN4486641.1 dienelactone hydrolase family protein [Demequina sp. SYSU T00039]
MPLLRSVLSPGWPGPTASPDRVALLLHGFGSHEHDLPGLAAFLPRGLPWASLRAPLEMGYGAAAWFPLSTDGAMDVTAIRSAADAVWDWVEATLPDDVQVVPMGFSQGGLMALQLLRTRPERVVAPVVLAGFVHEGEEPADAALARTRPPVFWGRGDADPVIWPEAVARTARWIDAHTVATRHVYPGLGHAVHEEEMGDVRAFLAAQLA